MWSLARSQAIDQPIQPLWACEVPAGGAARGLSHRALRSPVLGLWVEQLASAPDALPPEVSGVGAPPGFYVWTPSSLIYVRATGPQVSAGALGLLIRSRAHPGFQVWAPGH